MLCNSPAINPTFTRVMVIFKAVVCGIVEMFCIVVRSVSKIVSTGIFKKVHQVGLVRTQSPY